MSVTFVAHPDDGRRLQEALEGTRSVAVDCEAAGFHRYSDRICLIQLSTLDRTWVLDPLSMDPAPYVRPVLEDPAVPVYMHGAAYDLRLLRRDLEIEVAGLRDTQVAASLLGEPSVGLQALLERHLGVKVSKKYQRADWARRPLTEEMLAYAADDTRHLHELTAILEDLLAEAGREQWADEEYHWLMTSIQDPEPKEAVDPVTRVKGARTLGPLECTALRESLLWRDEIARNMDRAPFRVISDQTLLALAKDRPGSVAALAGLKGVSPRLAESHGEALLGQYRRIEAAAPEDWSPYPPPPPRRPRPTPEVEASLEALKAERNRVAEEIGLDRGRVMANHLLMEVAVAAPTDLDELLQVGDIRKWQVDLMGDRLLQALLRDDEEATSPLTGP